MAVQKGKRYMNWRNDKPATLYYVEALDGGDPGNKVEFRDGVYQWDAPFNSSPILLAKTTDRFRGIIWGDETRAILIDTWYDTRNVRTYLINPSDPAQLPKVIRSRNSQDIYSDPGQYETHKNIYGREILLLDKENAYLLGRGFTKKGQFPFIDQFNLKNI